MYFEIIATVTDSPVGVASQIDQQTQYFFHALTVGLLLNLANTPVEYEMLGYK